MASDIVRVFPVPGGPNIKYGAGLNCIAFVIAIFCSSFKVLSKK